MDAVAAGDGRELWVMQPGGRIAALRAERCLSEHGGSVSLSDCEASAAWEMQASNQLKSGSGGGVCLSASGASSGSNVALRAAVHASSAIDAAHGVCRRCWVSTICVVGSGHACKSSQELSWPLTEPMPRIVRIICAPTAAAKRCSSQPALFFHRGIWRPKFRRASRDDIGFW